jgi:preprotein translocase subunit YajC
MRKYLVAMTMLVTLGVGLPVMAQRQQPKDGQELVDSTQKSDALEAYSDTTDVADDTTVVSRHHRIGGYTNSIDNVNNIFERVFGIGVGGMAAGMVFVLLVLFILFVLAPVIILIVLFYFINKNRKQKMKLAEMAMKQGQPIPDQLLVEQKETDSELWQKGLRQTFLGVGLLAFFGYVGSTLGIGVGILVTVIGLGKLAIVKTSKNVEH